MKHDFRRLEQLLHDALDADDDGHICELAVALHKLSHLAAVEARAVDAEVQTVLRTGRVLFQQKTGEA